MSLGWTAGGPHALPTVLQIQLLYFLYFETNFWHSATGRSTSSRTIKTGLRLPSPLANHDTGAARMGSAALLLDCNKALGGGEDPTLDTLVATRRSKLTFWQRAHNMSVSRKDLACLLDVLTTRLESHKISTLGAAPGPTHTRLTKATAQASKKQNSPQHPVALGLDLEAEAEIGGIDIEVEGVGVDAHIGGIDIEVEVVGVPQGVAQAGEEVEGEGLGSSDLGSSEYTVHSLVGSRKSVTAASDHSSHLMDEGSDSTSALGLDCQSVSSEADTVSMGSSEELGLEPLAQVTQARGTCKECDTDCSNSDSDHREGRGIDSMAKTLQQLTSWRPQVTTKNTR